MKNCAFLPPVNYLFYDENIKNKYKKMCKKSSFQQNFKIKTTISFDKLKEEKLSSPCKSGSSSLLDTCSAASGGWSLKLAAPLASGAWLSEKVMAKQPKAMEGQKKTKQKRLTFGPKIFKDTESVW